MSLLPDVPYQPDMVVCPLCHGRQMVMYRTEGWATMARHLANGEWCPQVEVAAPTPPTPESHHGESLEGVER